MPLQFEAYVPRPKCYPTMPEGLATGLWRKYHADLKKWTRRHSNRTCACKRGRR